MIVPAPSPVWRTRWILAPSACRGLLGRADLSPETPCTGVNVRLDRLLGPGHARHLARRAVLEHADVVVAVGGDGTIHEVVNGLFDASIGGRAGPRLGIVDPGTSGGFAASLGLPHAPEDQIALLRPAGTRARRVDLGRLACASVDDRPVCRVFTNECQVGIGAAVSTRYVRRTRRLGGRLGRGLAALLTGLVHRSTRMSVSLDEAPPVTLRLLGVVVANGASGRGGVQLAPSARLDDGALDVVLIHEMPIGRRLTCLRRAWRGAHIDGVCCSVTRARRVRLCTSRPTPVAADGLLLGVTPLEIEIMPKAIGVLGRQGPATVVG